MSGATARSIDQAQTFAALRQSKILEFFANNEPKCPHCGHDCNIDDNEWWHLYSDDEIHEVSCPRCDGDFQVSTSASYSFSTEDQDALDAEQSDEA